MSDIEAKIKKLEKAKERVSDPGLPDWKVGQRKLEQLMTAIVVVLFIGFAGMFVAVGQMMVDALKDNRGSSNDFSDQLREQSNRVDALTNEVSDLNRALKEAQQLPK